MLSLVAKYVPLVGNLPGVRTAGRSSGFPDKSELYLNAQKMRSQINKLAFFGLVLIPTFLATLFFTLFAAPRYVSEAQYLVRSVSSQRATGLESLFRTFGIARTVDDSYAVEKFILSKDMLSTLATKLPLREIFGRKEADLFSRFPRFWEKDNEEYLHRYFLQRVTLREDDVKGITTLHVAAFRPEDAQTLAKAVLEAAEGMVNRLNARAQRDTVDSARIDVANAEKRVMEAQQKLSEFRTRELLVDPSKSSLAFIEQIASLNKDLSTASALYQQTQTVAPLSPQLNSQEARIKAIQDRIASEKIKLFGDNSAIANKIAEFEQLTLQRDIADKTLAESMTALETARQEARRQHVYVEEVVSAGLPDWPTEPERLRGILTVLVTGFAIFSVVWILSVGVGEHAQ